MRAACALVAAAALNHVTARKAVAARAALEERRHHGTLDAGQSAAGLGARGSLNLETASLRQSLADLAIDVPTPRDPKAFGAFSLRTEMAMAAGAIAIKPLNISLD